jgi:hypothetical protein
MANDVTIDPRYSKYTNKEIEAILDDVKATTLATEEGVRGIVRNWRPED